MKKVLFLIVVIFICMGATTGCGDKNSDPENGASGSGFTSSEDSSQDEPKAEDSNIDEETTDPVANGDEAINYLRQSVPEIDDYAAMIDQYNQDNGDNVKLIIRIDGEPDPSSSDPYYQDYWQIYVGENMGDHTNRWNTFYVRSDFNDIAIEDIVNGGYLTLADWREANSEAYSY